MGDENPNAQVEANLLEGKGRYASAGTTLQDILNDLDSTAAGLQSSWLGGASQDFQDKQGQLATTVQSASDVLQKGSISIGKMYDSYLEADEKQKLYKQVNDVLEKFMGVFMLFTAALGVVGAIIELADVAFAAEIGALEIAVEVGDVVPNVAADLGIEEVDTLSSLDNISDIDPLAEENPVLVDNPSEVPPQDAPVEDPQTDEAPPVDEPSEQPAPEPSKHDSAIDLSNDDKESLGKLDEPTVSETPKEIAPPDEPVQVYTVHTDAPDSPLTEPEYGSEYGSEDSPLTEPEYGSEDSPLTEPEYGSEDSPLTEPEYGSEGSPEISSPGEEVSPSPPSTPIDVEGHFAQLNDMAKQGQILAGDAADAAIDGMELNALSFADKASELVFDAEDLVSVLSDLGDPSITEQANNLLNIIYRNAFEASNAADAIGGAEHAYELSHSLEELRGIPPSERNSLLREAFELDQAQEPGTEATPRDQAPFSPSPAADIPFPPAKEPVAGPSTPRPPAEEPVAGPSTPKPPKRPAPEPDPDSEPDPNDPKGKKTKF